MGLIVNLGQTISGKFGTQYHMEVWKDDSFEKHPERDWVTMGVNPFSIMAYNDPDSCRIFINDRRPDSKIMITFRKVEESHMRDCIRGLFENFNGKIIHR